jgi:nitrite reductase/ring-hydroxylating ferredoxin subunit
MTGYVAVGRLGEFEEGVVRSIEVEGEPVAIVNWRERFYAFGEHCTHWGISLTGVYITQDNEICCLFHYAVFDMATGKVLDGPAREDLPVYDVRVEGDDVFVAKR